MIYKIITSFIFVFFCIGSYAQNDNVILEENQFPSGFFGEVEEEKEEIIIEESPFIEKKPEPKIIYIEKPDSKRRRATNSFSKNKFIDYEYEDESDLFIKEQDDEDNKSTIASRKYDLSKVITTNKFIPAVLITAINSEIASNGIVAQIERDVYGFNPKEVLLPRGSQVEGRVDSLEKNSTRANVSWYKIITPEGRIISLESTTFDFAGASGMSGELDNKVKERYGASILFSLINAATNFSIDAENQAQLMVAESTQRSLLPITNQILKDNFDNRPVIKLIQGSRLQIKPFQNIIFENVKKGVVEVKLAPDSIFNK